MNRDWLTRLYSSSGGGLFLVLSDLSEENGWSFKIHPNLKGLQPVLTIEGSTRRCDVSRVLFNSSFDPQMTSSGSWVIPVRSGPSIAAFVEVASAGGLQKQDADALCFLFDLFMQADASRVSYPGLFPALISHDPERLLQANNQLLQRPDSGVIFLNGQEGSGKKTWTECFVRVNRIDIDIERLHNDSFLRSFGGSDLVCSEIALLPLEEQAKMLKEEFSTMILMSKYRLDALYERGLVTDDVLKICSDNIVALPSFDPSSSEIVANFWSLFKGRGQVSISESLQTASEARRVALDASSGDLSILTDIFASGGNLRDAVARIEAEAIRRAHSMVGNSQNKIAELLGISRGSLQHKIRKYQLPYGDWD